MLQRCTGETFCTGCSRSISAGLLLRRIAVRSAWIMNLLCWKIISNNLFGFRVVTWALLAAHLAVTECTNRILRYTLTNSCAKQLICGRGGKSAFSEMALSSVIASKWIFCHFNKSCISDKCWMSNNDMSVAIVLISLLALTLLRPTQRGYD